MPAGPADHLPRPPARAADDPERGDRLGVAGVVRPVEALLDHDRGLGARSVDARLGHPLGGRADLPYVDLGHLGGDLGLGIVLRQQPFLPVLEAIGLELAPGRTPLPRRVARALAEAGGGLPLVVDPVPDPRAVLPAVLDDDPGDGEHHGQVGAGLDVEQEAPVLLGEGGARGPARQEEDRLLPAPDRRHDVVGEQDGLRLVGVGAAHQKRLGIGPVLVAGAEVVEARVPEARRRGHVRGRVVEGEVRRPDVPQRVLRDGVGVLHVAVGEDLDAIGVGAVRLEHVVADLGRDLQREVPGHRHQNAEHPHHRRLQPVAGRRLGVVDLLRDRPAPDRGVARVVDELRVLVGDDHDVMRRAVVQHDVVLVGRDPGPERADREVLAEGVLLGPGPAHLAAGDGPAIDLVSAGHDAVVAGGRDHLGVGRRKRNGGLRDVVGCGHRLSPFSPADCRSGRRSGRTCRRRRCRRPRVPAAPAAATGRPGRR